LTERAVVLNHTYQADVSCSQSYGSYDAWIEHRQSRFDSGFKRIKPKSVPGRQGICLDGTGLKQQGVCFEGQGKN